ncbi:MAG TPA: MarR family transcriptional regulator [Thermomicrobiales bacterium]|nr:MarR family transcriptional regulator [Thermomicrobiales bacterium]
MDSAVLAWVRLARVARRVERDLGRWLAPWGLSTAQFDALAQIGAAEGLTQQELAAALLVTKGNISQLLDRMEARGLIRRRQEGRAVRLALTDAGRRCRDEVVPAHEAWLAARFAALTPEEVARLRALLRKLDRAPVDQDRE